MTKKYLLPCACGAKTPIEITQAGGSATCTCGAALSIPTLGRLRNLEPVEEKLPAAQDSNWSAAHGMLFVLGGLIAVIGFGILAQCLYNRSQIDLSTTLETVAKDHEKTLDNMSPSALFDIWQKIRTLGIKDARKEQTPDYMLNLKKAESLTRTATIAGGSGGVGLLLVFATLIFRKRKRA